MRFLRRWWPCRYHMRVHFGQQRAASIVQYRRCRAPRGPDGAAWWSAHCLQGADRAGEALEQMLRSSVETFDGQAAAAGNGAMLGAGTGGGGGGDGRRTPPRPPPMSSAVPI